MIAVPVFEDLISLTLIESSTKAFTVTVNVLEDSTSSKIPIAVIVTVASSSPNAGLLTVAAPSVILITSGLLDV